ncbi:MAG: hypothetical protein HY367_01090 [Candidatus Aenigmarchaeota archaeon]|nr:hypothetical protein [Candidatus Aenigmarchaeota archaeon]
MAAGSQRKGQTEYFTLFIILAVLAIIGIMIVFVLLPRILGLGDSGFFGIF